MDFTKEQVLRINKEYQEMYDFIYNKLEEIGLSIKFLDKIWRIESFDFIDNEIQIIAYDSWYDQRDIKAITIPLDWLFDNNWREKWEKLEFEKEVKQKEFKEAEEYERFIELTMEGILENF